MKKTIKNLAKAFIGESQARNRYTFYAKIAKKEGYKKIAVISGIGVRNYYRHLGYRLQNTYLIKNL